MSKYGIKNTLTPICLQIFQNSLKLMKFSLRALILVNMLFVTRITLSHNKISGNKKFQNRRNYEKINHWCIFSIATSDRELNKLGDSEFIK